jgi:phosphoglycerate dehydrogenase-like enzyme
MFKVVYTDTEDLDPTSAIDTLQNAGFEVVRLETQNENLIAGAAFDAQGLLVGYAPLHKSLLDRLPQLEIVSLLSMGADNVDFDEVKRRNICLSNVGGAAAPEVASHSLALALALIRGLPQFSDAAQHGAWFAQPYVYVPPRLSTLRVGVLGFGQIGRELARIAVPLFAEVQFHDPKISAGEIIDSLRSVTFDELVETSDIISIHIPLAEENRRLFGASLLARMKRGSFLINVSRGQIVDSHALLEAIESGHIRGAALDVLDQEPPAKDHPLLNHPRILLTPHIGYLSEVTNETYVTAQALNIVDWFTGRTVTNAINEIRKRK